MAQCASLIAPYVLGQVRAKARSLRSRALALHGIAPVDRDRRAADEIRGSARQKNRDPGEMQTLRWGYPRIDGSSLLTRSSTSVHSAGVSFTEPTNWLV